MTEGVCAIVIEYAYTSSKSATFGGGYEKKIIESDIFKMTE